MNYAKITARKFFSINLQQFLSLHEREIIRKCREKNKDKFTIQLATMLQNIFSENNNHEALITGEKAPFIIGVNGSVSSGKSRLAREILRVLQCFNPTLKVVSLGTDNFIFSNKELEAKNIFDLKGETPSYNWKLLFRTLKRIKNNKSAAMPYYSQDLSDIHPKKKVQIPSNVDILIVEGINLLKTTCVVNKRNICEKLLLSDFLDYSIYIDTPERNLRGWFYKRLLRKKTLWKKKKIKHKLTRKNKKQFKQFADNIWKKYNKPNLERNIEPYRFRSDLIIYKNKHHAIKSLEFRI